MPHLSPPAGVEGSAAAPEAPRFITICTPTGQRHVPVYSLRNPDHLAPAARALAAGQTAAFYGGLYGIVTAVRPAWDAHDDAETYWRIKAGRPRWAKVPMLARPRDALRLIDFDLVHPAFRHLARRDRFEWLWTAHGGPLHVIAPLKQPLHFLHPAFQTASDDLRQQARDQAHAADRVVAHTTASFFWMADAAWESLATLTALYSRPRTFYGVSSFNEHGAHPPYTFAALVAYVSGRPDTTFDLVIHDELYEQSGAFSSHTQVRLPLAGEAPEMVVVRRGAVSPAWLGASTGYPVRVLRSAGVASRQPDLTDADLDARLQQLRAWRG